jgi:hypothetical protein
MHAMSPPPNGLPKGFQSFHTYSGWLLTTHTGTQLLRSVSNSAVFQKLWRSILNWTRHLEWRAVLLLIETQDGKLRHRFPVGSLEIFK